MPKGTLYRLKGITLLTNNIYKTPIYGPEGITLLTNNTYEVNALTHERVDFLPITDTRHPLRSGHALIYGPSCITLLTNNTYKTLIYHFTGQ
jgi:hypothetical protein